MNVHLKFTEVHVGTSLHSGEGEESELFFFFWSHVTVRAYVQSPLRVEKRAPFTVSRAESELEEQERCKK